MMQRKPMLIAALVVAVLGLASLAQAATYYLDAINGNDTTGDGSSGAPWASMSKVFTVVAPNDTVLLRPGNYGSAVFGENQGVGTAAGRITYMADPATTTPRPADWFEEEIPRPDPQNPVDKVIFSGIEFEIYSLDKDSGTKTGTPEGHYVTIDGLNVVDGTVFLDSYVSYVTIRNCNVFGTWGEYSAEITGAAYDMYRSTVWGSNYRHILIEDCYATRGQSGLNLLGNFYDITVRGCHFYHHSSSQMLVQCDSVDQLTIEGNHAHHWVSLASTLKHMRTAVTPDAVEPDRIFTVDADVTYFDSVAVTDADTGTEELRKVISFDHGTYEVVLESPLSFDVEPGDTVEFWDDTHGSGVAIRNGNFTLRGNRIHDVASTGTIYFYAPPDDGFSDVIIENNLTYSPVNSLGVYFANRLGNNCVIRNNTFVGTQHPNYDSVPWPWIYYGFAITSCDAAPNADPSTITIANNLFVGDAQAPAGAIIKNNIVYSSANFGGGGFEEDSVGDNADNLVYYQGEPYGSEPHTFDGSGNYFVGGGQFDTLAFKVQHSENFNEAFRIVATADAVGYADPALATATDMTGAPRDGAPDVGCYEFGGNQPPTADAGPDQNVTDTDDGGDEDVTLDGSGSTDSDGTITDYDWEEASVPIATGVSPVVTLTVAVHTIDLTVTDDDLATDSDSVVITVNPGGNIPPTADAGPDQNVTDTDDGGDEDVTLDGSGSTDSDGTITDYDWEEASVPIATGVSPLVTLTVAVHTIDLTVTDDDLATDSDSVVVTVNPAPGGGGATLTVVETVGDYYTITAHDSVTPSIEYWEAKVDVEGGGVFSFKDLTDAGDGGGDHTNYLGTDAYGRCCSLIYFDGRGGNVMTLRGPVDDQATRLTFDTAGDGSAFTITYAEAASETDYFHDVYGGDLAPGELLTTITLVITPPDENGTAWDWTISNENVAARNLTWKIWAEEHVFTFIEDAVVTTTDNDTSFVDGAWNPVSPESFCRWTVGVNPGTGLTEGREFVIDWQSGLAAFDAGNAVTTGAWAGFNYQRYSNAFSFSGSLPMGQTRVSTGQVIVDIVGTAAPPNNPPTADAGPDQNVTDNDDNGSEDVTLDGSGSSDSDGTIVSYEWEEASVPIASGVSPLVTLSVAVHTIDLIVTDDDTDTDTDSVVITVNPYVNVPPTADAGPDQNVTDTDDGGDEDVTLDGSGSSDSDGTIVSYEWEEATVPIATGVGPLVTLSVAVHTIDLIVTDDDTDTDADSVIITVNPYVNVPPTADAGPDQLVTDTDLGGDEDVTLDGSGSSDSDGTIVSYEWEEASVPIASGVSPLVTLAVGTHTIDLTVTDDDTDTDSDSVVIEVNDPPTADAGPDQNVTDNDDGGDEDVTLDGSGSSDSDGSITAYDWEESSVPIASGVSPLVTLSVAVHTIDLIVTDDDSATGTDSVVVTVNPYVNIPPTADAGPDQNVTDNDDNGSEDVTLDGSGSSDSDGSIVSYEWEESSVPIASGVSPLVTLSVAVHTIDLIVTDDDTDTDTDSVVITVNPYVNVPPTADAGPDQSISDSDDSGSEDVTLDGSGSSDSDGSITDYDWEEASVPIASGVSPVVSLAVGSHTIDLTVTDDDTDTDTDSVVVLVSDAQVSQGLAGFWPFEGSGSTVDDDSGNGHTGTLNSATRIAGGYIDNGLSFDQVDDYVEVPDWDYTNAADEFSVSFWFNIDNVDGVLYQYVFSHGLYGDNNSLNVYFREAQEPEFPEVVRSAIWLNDGTSWLVDTPTQLADGVWHMYTITVSATAGAAIYIDGSPVLSDANLKGAAFNPTTDVYLGARCDLNENRFYGATSVDDGLLDEVRIYGRALSAQEVSTLFSGAPNVPPTADAGPDQTVTDADRGGDEDVTLDGSGSSDSDGTIVSYDWEEASVPIASGVSPVVLLTVGTHTIDLIVTDDDTDTDTDSVVIDVNDPPTANAGTDQNVTDNDDNGTEDVTLDGSGSSDSDGSIAAYDWEEASVPIASGVSPLVTLSVAVHTIDLIVTDDDSATDTDSVVVTVNPYVNVPPTADAGPDQDVTDNDDGGDEDVTLDGSGSSDSDGTITAYDWEEASVPIASGVSPLVTLSVAVHTIDLIVTDDDLDTDTDSVIVTVNPYVNVPPTADAGPDQNVNDADDSGDEDITLDGSGSSDSDGTITAYDWEEASIPIASGVSPLVTLSVAVHTIDLIVTDDDLDTDTDSVIITVTPYVNVPPTADAGPDQNVTDTDDSGDEDVTLDGSASSDSDGTITAYDWEEASVPIASGVSPVVTLSVAVHTIDLIVTDDDLDTDTDSVQITVNPYVNVPPTADAGPDQNVTDIDDGGDEDVTLDGSASSDSDGTITAYDWEEASVPIASGVSPVVTLSVAVHTIDLIVTDDDSDTDTDSVVITVSAPTGGVATLVVVETPGDYYTITAEDSVDPQVKYWEIKVDVEGGGIFSFKDLTDAGDGGGGHNSYLDTNAYDRNCSLIYFDGRGGNVMTRRESLDDQSTRLTFDTAGDGSSFTITYTETASETDYFHDIYGADLAPGELLTTITLVITPPDENGTAWDWTVSSENVATRDLVYTIWAQEYVAGYLYDSIVKTVDVDETYVDGPWSETTPVSYFRWTIGDNPSLGFTNGREIIIDRQTSVGGIFDAGGSITQTTWAGFAHNRYMSAFSYSGALAIGASRVQTGQVIIDIIGTPAPPNDPPTADAGPDQNVTDTDDSGDEDVTLDGSGSSDSDGTIVSYEWEEASVPIASGVSPLVTLSVAVHTIDLIVTDDDTDTDTDSVVITVDPAPAAGEVLFVANTATLGTADQIVADLLTGLGYTVTPMDDNVATAADATGKVLVVISATVKANTVGAEFRTVAAPVLTWESAIMNDMDMTTAQGTDARETTVDIVDPGHAMAAGLSGIVTVYLPRETLSYGVPTVAADVVATVDGDASRAVLFGYDTSAVMANGYAAPARRVGVFLDANSAQKLTTDGTSLIDAALSWALGL